MKNKILILSTFFISIYGFSFATISTSISKAFRADDNNFGPFVGLYIYEDLPGKWYYDSYSFYAPEDDYNNPQGGFQASFGYGFKNHRVSTSHKINYRLGNGFTANMGFYHLFVSQISRPHETGMSFGISYKLWD